MMLEDGQIYFNDFMVIKAPPLKFMTKEIKVSVKYRLIYPYFQKIYKRKVYLHNGFRINEQPGLKGGSSVVTFQITIGTKEHRPP